MCWCYPNQPPHNSHVTDLISERLYTDFFQPHLQLSTATIEKIILKHHIEKNQWPQVSQAITVAVVGSKEIKSSMTSFYEVEALGDEELVKAT